MDLACAVLEYARACAAIFSSTSGSILWDLMATTLGLPSERVPALSKATTPVVETLSIALHPSNRIPAFAAPPMALSLMSGMAIKSEQGFAITRNIAALRTDSPMLSSVRRGRRTIINIASTVTAGAKYIWSEERDLGITSPLAAPCSTLL